jgi:hypothetical protein
MEKSVRAAVIALLLVQLLLRGAAVPHAHESNPFADPGQHAHRPHVHLWSDAEEHNTPALRSNTAGVVAHDPCERLPLPGSEPERMAGSPLSGSDHNNVLYVSNEPISASIERPISFADCSVDGLSSPDAWFDGSGDRRLIGRFAPGACHQPAPLSRWRFALRV